MDGFKSENHSKKDFGCWLIFTHWCDERTWLLNLDLLVKENPENKKSPNAGDAKYPEFYSNEHYETIEEALKVFQEDELLFEPGAEFSYTTHGFTLLSAVIESVSGKEWLKSVNWS